MESIKANIYSKEEKTDNELYNNDDGNRKQRNDNVWYTVIKV